MALIRRFWTVISTVILMIYWNATVAPLDPEIGQQIDEFDLFLAKYENFELRCFITDIDYYIGVVNEINLSFASAFKEAGIEIPYPQTDLHLKSSEVPAFARSK